MSKNHMSKNQRQMPRKPAVKFAHLRKKLDKQRIRLRLPKKK